MQEAPYREVPLYGRDGKVRGFTLIDLADYEWAMERRWCLMGGHAGRFYAGRSLPMPNGKRGTIVLHRDLLNVPTGDPREVDHINNDGLDNRRANLEITTRRENMKRVYGRTDSCESLRHYIVRLERRLEDAKTRLARLER